MYLAEDNTITSLEKMKLLLDHGAYINETDENGWTALMFAAKKSNLNGVKLLLDRGADVNATNNLGKTAFSLASHPEIVALISEKM